MDFDDIYALYTRKSYNSILIQLRQDVLNQTDGLTKLSSLLTYGDQEKLIEFPIEDFAREVLHILDTTTSENLAMLASKCVFGLLEAHTRSTAALISNNALKILAKHLIDLVWYETAEFCIQSLHIISKYRAIDIGLQIGLDPLLKMIEHFQITIQRCALTACENITNTEVTDEMTNHIPKLLEFSKSKDPRLQSSAIKTINNIASRVSPESVNPQITALLCQSAPVFIDTLINLSTHRRHIQMIIQSNIDFDKIFSEAKNSEKQMAILKLILNLLPPAKCLNSFNNPKHLRPEESNNFAIKIQPILIKLLLENPLSLTYLLKCIASTLNVQKIELTEELAFALRGFAKTSENSPYVLAILTFFESSPLLGQSHILDYLIPGIKLKQQKTWFTKTLNKLRKKVSQNLKESANLDNCTIEDMTRLISDNSISKFEFLTTGVKRLKELFAQSAPDGSKLLISYENAQILANFLLSLLDIVDLPVISGSLIIDQFLDEITHHNTMVVPIEIPDPDESGNRLLPLKINRFETVGSIEYVYNYKVSELNYGIENLIDISATKPNLKSLVINDSLKNITNDQLSIIYKAFDPNYPRYHIERSQNQAFDDYNYGFSFNFPPSETESTPTTEPKKYNSNYSLFYIVNKQNSLISLVEGDCDPQPPIIPKKTFDSLTGICELLEKLSNITSFGQNDIFSRKIHNLLINPRESLYHCSVALDTIYMYPFLFPFDIRLFAFKMVAFEPTCAIRAWAKEFSISNAERYKDILKSEPLKVTVNRESLFNDGFELFSELSSNQMKFEISFLNEQGIGLGPTHEFFTLFSHELCHIERGLFRTEETVERGEPVIDKNGMFFSPLTTRRTKAATILGKFIAKSIQMECLIDINFNPALFKLCRGEEVSVYDVDERFDMSLNNPEGLIGMTFVYPGLNLPLVQGGEDLEVTEANLKEYVDLIRDFTCGKKMEPVVKNFVDGFNSVFPFVYLDIFNETELIKIITGDAPQITREELEKNVEITHGYTSESKQIEWLFEIIHDMSKEDQRLLIQFITGFAQLPIGGLASLKPKLSVAKRDPKDETSPDVYFPSCMTCMNYFKLPPYSSKAIMEERILKAIYEGRTLFNMT